MVRSYTAKLSTEQENSLKVLDAMGRTLDRKINIVDSIDTEGGKANAYFDPKTNEYTIALDSVGEAYLLVAAHENVHDIAANTREGYAKMESIVMDTLESLGLDEETLMDVQRALAPSENEAYWREEIVANTVPSILSDEATLKEFVQKMAGADVDTRSAFVKFLDTMRDFLRNAFDKLKVELSWQQMQIISENQQAIERIRGAYFEALDGMMAKTDDVQSTGETKYSPRLPENFISKAQIEENKKNVINMKPVADVKGNEFPASNGDLQKQLSDYFDEIGGYVENPELGKIELTKRSIKNDNAHGMGRMKIASYAAVPAVIRNGGIINAEYNWKGRGYDTVVMAAPITYANEEAVLGVVLRKMNNRDDFYVHEVVIERDASTFRTRSNSLQKANTGDDASLFHTLLQSLWNYKGDSQIKFSMQDNVEETDKLLAIHNLTGGQLNGVLELGGFPMPSIAVLKATQGHDRYGDVSVVFDKATIDPEASTRKYLFLRSSNPPLHPPALSPAAPP